MWVYESEQNITKDLFIRGGIIFPFIFVCILVLSKIGVWDRSYSYYTVPPRSWDEIIVNLPFYFIISFIVSLFVSYITLRKFNGLVCLKCGKSKASDTKKLFCECGGTFESLYKLKWVEDKNDKENL